MLHAVKTSLGSFKIVEDEGTYVIMTNEEYHDYVKVSRMLRDDIRRFSRESIDLHCRLQDDLKTIETLKSQLAKSEAMINELSEQKDALEKSLAAVKDDLAKLTDNLEHAESLNKNLKRICREHANQARDLPKSSDGYVVLVSQEWREKAQNGRLIRGYKTQIQSPHDASMDDETAKKQIFEDLVDGVLADLGCPYYEQVNGRPAEPIDEMSMYRCIYTADYRSSGLWLVTIYTSGPLKVPPHRRPQQRQKKSRNQGVTSNDKSKYGRGAEKSAEEGN
jgi:uncharacterized coiled-coil protein SlyX